MSGVYLWAWLFALIQPGLAQKSQLEPKTAVATVNGEIITLREVDAIISQRPTPANAPAAAPTHQLRLDVINALVDEMLLQQFFRDHATRVDPKVVAAQFSALETGLKMQNNSLSDYLRENHQTEAQVKSNLALLLQLDAYVRQHSSDADIRQYYEANKAYFDGVTVRSSHIVMRTSGMGAAEKEKTRAALSRIRQDLLAGRLEFAQAARQFSQCPSSSEGGDLGFITRKFSSVEEAYAKAAFALKLGELSDVVESDYGMHLIKVTARQEGKASKFEAVADTVRDCYAEELRVALLNDLRKKARITVNLP